MNYLLLAIVIAAKARASHEMEVDLTLYVPMRDGMEAGALADLKSWFQGKAERTVVNFDLRDPRALSTAGFVQAKSLPSQLEPMGVATSATAI
eukprot:g20329.t1